MPICYLQSLLGGLEEFMSAEAVRSSGAKLPVFITIAESIAVMKPAWRPIVLQLAVIAVLSTVTDLLDLMAESPGNSAAYSSSLQFASGVGSLLLLMMFTNLVLGISRLALFKEIAAVTDLFRWGRRQWRLLSNILLIGLIMVMPAGVGALFSASLGSFLASPVAVAAFLLLYAACWLWAGAWLGLLAPIIASDERKNAIDCAWRISAGNRMPLVLLGLCGLGAYLVIHGTGMLLATFINTEMAPLRITGSFLTAFFSTALSAVSVAIAAIAYKRLTGQAVDRDMIEAE